MSRAELEKLVDAELWPIHCALSPAEEHQRATGDITLAERRGIFNAMMRRWNDGLPILEQVRDFSIPCADSACLARLYRPPFPSDGLALFLHGGGWIVGNLDTNDSLLRYLALQSGVSIVALGYRLAPETTYPGQIEDAVSAARWLINNPQALSLRRPRLALIGDSAGANLALAAAIELTTAERPYCPTHLQLYYGAMRREFTSESHLRFGGAAFGHSSAALQRFWDVYVGDAAERGLDLSLLEPSKCDLSALPSTHLVIAGLDALRDDSRDLFRRLELAGVHVSCDEYPQALHGFLTFCQYAGIARRALDGCARRLRNALA